jgi:hypothetical protein
MKTTSIIERYELTEIMQEIKYLVQQTIRETLAQNQRNRVLQDLMNKKYVTQSNALRYLSDVGIKRGRFERMLKEGVIRCRDKEETGARYSSVRIYSADIYMVLEKY